jgi:hypothetical protein
VDDMKVKGKVESTYAPAVAFDSARLLVQLRGAAHLQGRIWIIALR